MIVPSSGDSMEGTVGDPKVVGGFSDSAFRIEGFSVQCSASRASLDKSRALAMVHSKVSILVDLETGPPSGAVKSKRVSYLMVAVSCGKETDAVKYIIQYIPFGRTVDATPLRETPCHRPHQSAR